MQHVGGDLGHAGLARRGHQFALGLAQFVGDALVFAQGRLQLRRAAEYLFFQHDGGLEQVEVRALGIGAALGAVHQGADDLVEPDDFAFRGLLGGFRHRRSPGYARLSLCRPASD
ncbi:hypothetical protein D3C84_688870 [compost metagenome]